ncbi:xanthine permease [Actinobacteria bacterium YIM 96077]|uniref:Xanthine permease n=1 Tax=Phytoactinopolyspora halophila TaxID=1981511 RepID=A0A329QMQ8_9ACTN|nr:solute carrier family 23 protein [Phytoactinopolyspora halophila]AYY12947.1 xanthine permease [Actinobacteria bacterium YIM 96077]RAW13211.1 xanthine permease [Phytoactinopolyspora halophila]
MSTTSSKPVDLNYGLEDVPKPLAGLGLGIQHVLTMFGATVAVPLILGPAMEMSPDQLAILVSSVMICSGIATFIQARFGTRLPIIQGVSFAFLGPFFAIIAATVEQGGDVSMQYIAGAIIAGAVLEIVLGYTGLFGKIRRFISPVVIGPVIALIGLALFENGAPDAALNWWIGGLTIVASLGFALILAPRVRFFSLFPILLAVLTAYLVALFISVTGIISEDNPAYISFDSVGDAPWIRSFVIGDGGILLPWGWPQFALGFILATLAGYLASMIESFGDYHAISRAIGKDHPTEKQISRGIGAEGVGCLTTGLFGGFASTSYTENLGLVAMTKVASRRVVYIAAGLLIILGFVAKFGAVIATIPTPIVGGLYCTLFGLIAAIGLSNLTQADMTSQRNLLIVGFILFMGLSVPAYFEGVEIHISWAEWLGDVITTVGSTGMAVAAIFGLILDNLIPGTPEERGIPRTEETHGPVGEAADD